MTSNAIWQVKETACYPNSWKVYPTRKYIERNDKFYPTQDEAQKVADRLNEQEVSDTD